MCTCAFGVYVCMHVYMLFVNMMCHVTLVLQVSYTCCCITPQHTATHCNTLLTLYIHTCMYIYVLVCVYIYIYIYICTHIYIYICVFLCVCSRDVVQNAAAHSATHCNTLRYTFLHMNESCHTYDTSITLQHTAPHCNTLHVTATYRTALQHTATHV